MFFRKLVPALFTVAVVASLTLGSSLADVAVKPGANQPKTVQRKPSDPQSFASAKKTDLAAAQAANKKPLEPGGRAHSKQTGPPPVQANIFWWPLEAGPNNDPNWQNGLSMEELYRELRRTMDKLDELGGPGIWNGCKEYNDWQRHRELLLDQLRTRLR